MPSKSRDQLHRDLYLLFRKFGQILSVHTMVNKETGLSRGYGFVSYSERQEAQAAIANLNGFRVKFQLRLHAIFHEVPFADIIIHFVLQSSERNG